MQTNETFRSAPNLPRLTGIRAIAAIFVVYRHFDLAIPVLIAPLARFRFVALAGPVGVDLFFILSGFILSHNYLSSFLKWPKGAAYRKFLVARFARIYPVHLATLLCLALIILGLVHSGRAFNPASYTVKQFLFNLVLVQAWPGVARISWNYPSWSISAEAFAYVLFPVCAPIVARAKRPLFWSVITLSLFLVPAWLGWISEGYPSNWALVRVSAEFFSGCFLYRAYKAGIKCPVSPGVSGVASLAIGLTCSYLGFHITFAVPAFLLLIWGLAQRPQGFLSGRVAQYAGRVSYSLYMTHGMIQIILARALPPERFAGVALSVRIGILAVYTAIVLATAIAAYHWIEVPAREWILKYPWLNQKSNKPRWPMIHAH
jgi:peptidoglycan/LPS O-acetylase OafA/YrhL